jgi:putative transcriptional regulator
MIVSYNGLWKLLIDKNMKRMDLAEEAGISTSTIAKMGRGEPVSMEVLGRICEKLNCDFGDLVSYEGNGVTTKADNN